MLRGLNQLMERKEGEGMYLLWASLIGDVRTLMMDEAHASRVEVGDKVMLEVSSWKDAVHFGKKEMLHMISKTFLRSFKGSVYGLLISDCLNYLKPVEIIDREVKSLKRSRIPIVKSIGTRSEVMRIS
ncbi:hypothetical protein Tco_0698066 [Tanacetum coccineum]